MKNISSRLIPVSLLIALLMTFVPAMDVQAAPAITSIVPNQVVNNVATTITINGSGFSAGSVVVLLNGSAISTSVVNDFVITATVPAGLGVGSYTVTVSNGIDPDVSCNNCLTVVAPTPIPPTPVPTATTAPLPFTRPQFVVRSSRITGGAKTGGNVALHVVVENVGHATAYSAQAVYTSADLVPTKTGGVVAIGTVAYDDEVDVSQSFYVSAQISGRGIVVADMTITYYDDKGSTYSDKFTLSIPVSGVSSGGGVAGPTATPTSVKTSQLVITNYSASVDPLQPGMQFSLKMTVQNVGNANAQRITMIVGGGSSGGGGGGTPQPGGVSGGSGEFTNFAQVGASNVQSLGDLAAGDSTQASQNLIVNVSTAPGAYPMKVTFSYLNSKNEVINDEQVITLLVYSLPSVDVSFYRPPDPFFVGQPGALPIQVVNLGKRLSVLGNIKITSDAGTVENGTSLVGSLDAGGYFTIDSMLIPEKSGTVTLEVVIDYVDDFNAPRSIEKTLEVEVMEGFIEEPIDPSLNGGGGGEEFPVMTEETIWQKIWRFILGLFGLDSSVPSDGGAPIMEPGMEQPVPVRPGTGKG